MTEELIIGGFGGQGILQMGELLVFAASLEGKEALCVPFYTPEVRGGRCSATVIVSTRPVGCMLVAHPVAGIAMDAQSLDELMPIVKPEGLLLANSAMAQATAPRRDLHYAEVDVVEIAERLANPRVANSAMLGTYIALRPHVVSVEYCLKAMESSLRGSAAKHLEVNQKAFRAGVEAAVALVEAP